jgi:hypothetical protein
LEEEEEEEEIFGKEEGGGFLSKESDFVILLFCCEKKKKKFSVNRFFPFSLSQRHLSHWLLEDCSINSPSPLDGQTVDCLHKVVTKKKVLPEVLSSTTGCTQQPHCKEDGSNHEDQRTAQDDICSQKTERSQEQKDLQQLQQNCTS